MKARRTGRRKGKTAPTSGANKALMGSVEASDGKIIWRKFEQPYQPARDYSSFGPFVFELEQYKEALRNLPKSVGLR